jgi:hypothetical protein
VLEATIWGLTAASTLLVGAILAIALPWLRRAIGLAAVQGRLISA